LTLVKTDPNELLQMKLEITRPMNCSNDVAFKLVPTGDGTRVTWSMEGPNNFISKAMSAFVNMDALVGKPFEEGLASLNVLAQADAGKQGAAAENDEAPDR
jgi:hypothetical protein